MRLASWRNRFVFLAIFFAGTAVGGVAAPVWRTIVISVSQERYSDLTFKCDDAMRAHLLAKSKLTSEPNEENVADLRSAEITLLDCQDYDLMRKRLIRWGLSDNELSEMALTAIEERGKTLQQVINIHEIRY